MRFPSSVETPPSATAGTARVLPWRAMALVTGDALAFFAFAALGRRTHAEAAGLDAIGLIALTALPFAAGWFAVSPWVGAFRHAATGTTARMLARTELGWLAAWPVALALRWAIVPTHEVPLSFALVALAANALLLGAWRSVFALVASWVGRR